MDTDTCKLLPVYFSNQIYRIASPTRSTSVGCRRPSPPLNPLSCLERQCQRGGAELAPVQNRAASILVALRHRVRWLMSFIFEAILAQSSFGSAVLHSIENMPKQVYCYEGSHLKLAPALIKFFERGRITYNANFDDTTADTDSLEFYTSALQELMKEDRGLNAKYSTLMKSVFWLLDQKLLSKIKTSKLTERKLIAGEEAAKLRAMSKHVRRQWYRRSKKDAAPC